MAEDRLRTWQIEGTVPVEEENGRKWNRNVRLVVIAFTMDAAMAIVMVNYPDYCFHKVMIDRYIDDVLVAAGVTDG